MNLRRPASITARLTLGLGAIALLVFSASGVLLQRSLASDLAAADLDLLRGKAQLVLHFIEEARKSRDAPSLQHHLNDLSMGHPGLHIWVQSASGETVYGGALPAPKADPEHAQFIRVALGDSAQLDAWDTRLSDLPPWPGGLMRVGIDTGPRLRLLAVHRNTLVAVCALGVVLTVALSGVVIGRGLAAVKRLSADASEITPELLGKRLSKTPSGHELEGLVQAFNGVLDRLEGAYAQMEAFNANVAHELRTPLATMINGIQVTLSARRSGEELKEMLASTLEDLERMNALVSDMLFLARADRGHRAPDLESVDLAAEADRTVHYCDALLQEAGVRARRTGRGTASCNPSLVRRALVNLLLNAIRYTPSGEEVVVEIEQSAARVRIAVFNPGPEISADVRARMFERFFHTDASPTNTGEGHGLGLSIVAAIARMHRGRVFAEYNGVGNRIGLEIPVSPASS
jgi:two-component system heavy metal sensor histidine kinase CusS